MRIINKYRLTLFPNDIKLHYALRVAIACAVACLIYRISNLSVGYWVLITAVITIQANLGASIKRAKDRLLGTFLGVLVGGFSLVMFYDNFTLIFIISLCLIFLTVYFYTTSYDYAIFFGTILLILLLGQAGYASWDFAIYRLIDTITGLIIGLAASYLLWPKNAKAELYTQISESVINVKEYFISLLQVYQQKSLINDELLAKQLTIENALVTNRKLFQEFTYEPDVMKVSSEAVYSIILNLEIIYDILLTIKITLECSASQLLNDTENNRISVFSQRMINILTAIADIIKVGPGAKINEEDLNIFIEQLQQNLLDEEEVRNALILFKHDRFNLILLTTNIKRLATKLKYIIESVKQLNYINGN